MHELNRRDVSGNSADIELQVTARDDLDKHCKMLIKITAAMNGHQKSQLVHNLVGAVRTVPTIIKIRQIGHFYNADPKCS